MAKRILDDSLLTSPSLASCSPRAQDAFPRLILMADDFGCFEANPRVLLGRGWSLRTDVSEEDVSAWLAEYGAARSLDDPEAVPMVVYWSASGRMWGFLTGWFGPHGQRKREEYSEQNQKGSKRKTPAPPSNLLERGSRPGNAGFPPTVARETAGKSEIPPGKCDFPRPQSQFQTLSQAHTQPHDQEVRALPVPSGLRAAESYEPPQQATQSSMPLLVPVTSPTKPDKPSVSQEERAAKSAIEDVYRSERGEPYPWGADDWKSLRKCLSLAAGNLDVLKERWSHALELGSKYPGCSKLRELAGRWPHVLNSLQERAGKGVSDEDRAAAEEVKQAYMYATGLPYPWEPGDWDNLRACLSHAQGDVTALAQLLEFGAQLARDGKYPGCASLRQLRTKWAEVQAAYDAAHPTTNATSSVGGSRH